VSHWLKCIALERLYLFQIGAFPKIPHTNKSATRSAAIADWFSNHSLRGSKQRDFA